MFHCLNTLIVHSIVFILLLNSLFLYIISFEWIYEFFNCSSSIKKFNYLTNAQPQDFELWINSLPSNCTFIQKWITSRRLKLRFLNFELVVVHSRFKKSKKLNYFNYHQAKKHWGMNYSLESHIYAYYLPNFLMD